MSIEIYTRFFSQNDAARNRKKLNYAFVEIVAINQIMAPYISVLISSFRYINNMYVIYLYEMYKKICKNKEQDFHTDTDKHMGS